ncbi:FKBP-type peptidyl-prolyl cis-trans isomerase [Ursidibacter maritimus]|uniref:Peptidyl-prolyl cis-trans isomerase n=1 Tax=Ursidibacter maritimus TaxID=1331689 RepID=A0A949WGN1_9PAST|nr:FKBP-type peptidyl-prolyl cis-trans isomerase [Ursidibacter maritimus]KAE9542172.1 peptidylprolyl isomerase [Ursidibacter maritimus]MBV6524263.1 FKBP-type peptidyl-prolyl cis-trans isomerase [Ursidibacter maritimus]MBV6526530.1 FKBP-type peptidyl-prolyl cis-trans isomerase [Ursidibacter maritimus]MBV6528398.1 FKBP-type peptidyl-prolyl cis-trans isomerase [Ursidibacter maritimus]MBV6530293.1 FKBP-type peptidyl-prolyl cis-trans isomerase [Ursidibacter maritimus]
MLKTKLSAVAVLATTLFTAQTALAEKADPKFVDDSSYAFGVLMGKNIEGMIESQKNLFPYNQDRILAGVQDTLKKSGKLTDDDLKKQLENLDKYLREQENKIQAEKNKATTESGNKYRADYEKKSGVKKTASGLLYKIENAGEGESPKATDTVKVHYKGTLTDGTVFDSSYERKEPIEFQLNQLIPGWIEAIPMLKKGGKMEIVLPPQLGYGDRQAGKIPANSTLIFEIELLDFKAAK